MIGRRRARLGLGIGSERVSAVLVERGRIVWSTVRERTAFEPLEATLTRLLGAVPRRRWARRPAVVAAVGPTASQLKRIVGLPHLTEPAAVAALVRENVARFFLKDGVPLLTAGVRLVEPGIAWAAAVEAPLVASLERACRATGLVLGGVVPVAIALERAAEGETVEWRDGDARLTVALTDGAVATVRRSTAVAGDGGSVLCPTSLIRGLEGGAVPVADAFGAAMLPHDEPLALRTAITAPAGPSRRRLRAALAACAIACLAALLAPGLAAMWVAHRADRRLAAIAPRARAAATRAARLGHARREAETIADLAAGARPATLLLTEIARALPERAALVALEVNASTGTGSLVAIAPRATQVMDAVERVSAFASPTIEGPVTPESVGGTTVERLTVRVRVLPALEPPR